jgi:ribonuclease HII
MKLPSYEIEKGIGFDKIFIGIDEAGRGPLAGPVVAAAVWVNPEIFNSDFPNIHLIRDSKTLSEKQRVSICQHIEASNDFIVGMGQVSHLMIDRINILNATLLAMRLAVEEVKSQMSIRQLADKNSIQNSKLLESEINDFCLLVDGNRRIPKIKYEQRLFVQGDARVFSIAAASICAKVYRDDLMKKYDEKYPVYGFGRHKGYGTKVHLGALKKHGPCDIHRKSFTPVKDYVKSQKVRIH